uniref:Uncharacterized protein n=1 Tax=Trichuris muris TaxID=70415 RepID=A0A5S6QCB4_TRIMR
MSKRRVDRSSVHGALLADWESLRVLGFRCGSVGYACRYYLGNDIFVILSVYSTNDVMNVSDDGDSVASCDAFNDETFDVDVPDEEWDFDGAVQEKVDVVRQDVGTKGMDENALVSVSVAPNRSLLHARATSNSSVVDCDSGSFLNESIERMIELSLTDLIDDEEDFVALKEHHVETTCRNDARFSGSMRVGPAVLSDEFAYERMVYAGSGSAELGHFHFGGTNGQLDGYLNQPVEVKGMKTVEELEAEFLLKKEPGHSDAPKAAVGPCEGSFNGTNASQHSSTAELNLVGAAATMFPSPRIRPVPPADAFVRPFHCNGAVPPFYANHVRARALPHPLMHPAGIRQRHPAMSAPRTPPICPVMRPPPPPGAIPPEAFRSMPNPGLCMPDQRSCPRLPPFPFPRYCPSIRMQRPFSPCRFDGAGDFPGRFIPFGFGPGRPGFRLPMRPPHPRMGVPAGEWCQLHPYYRGYGPRAGRGPNRSRPLTMMSRCERSWISRVMSISQISEQDDYYYRKWCQKRGICIRQVVEAASAKDAECDSLPNAKVYQPPKFEGSLGSIQQITTGMPRRLLVVSDSQNMVTVGVPSISSLSTYKILLLYVDNLFLILLADDCSSDDGRSKAAGELTAAKLHPHLGNNKILCCVLQIAKGQELFGRYLSLCQHNVLLLFNNVLEVLPALKMASFSAKALRHILTVFSRSVDKATGADVGKCMKIVEDKFKSLSPGCVAKSKILYSVALCASLLRSKGSQPDEKLAGCDGAVKNSIGDIVGASVECPLTDEELALFGSNVLKPSKQNLTTSAAHRIC